jgi:hypothetical protein
MTALSNKAVMSSLVTYLPAAGAMLFFFGAMLFQSRAHPRGRTPEQAELSFERERS